MRLVFLTKTINHKLEFQTYKTNEIIIKKTKDYFLNQGFKLLEEQDGNLCFVKGNLFLNALTMNPLGWKSKTTVNIEGGKVDIDFEINTIFQIGTKKEKNLWQTFVNNYQKSIEEDQSYLEENQAELGKIKITFKKGMWYMLLFFLLCVVSYSLGVLLAISKNKGWL